METMEAPSVPTSPDLIWMVLIQQAMMLTAWIIGLVVRRGLKNCMMMFTAPATLAGLTRLWKSLLLAGWIFGSGGLRKPRMIGFVAMIAVLVIVIVAVVLVRLNSLPDSPPINEIATMGKSETREFRSPACWNLCTGRRGREMETITAKTMSTFLSSRGGTLLIGVDNEGELISLGNDYSTSKSPDADRLEL